MSNWPVIFPVFTFGQDPIVFNRYKIYATTSKDDLLNGEKPMLFDEWQKIPELWDFIRLDIDEHPGDHGRYILTGSAKPLEEVRGIQAQAGSRKLR